MSPNHKALLLCAMLAIGACSDGGGGSAPPQDLPPTLSAINDASVMANSPEARIAFSVGDDMTPAGDINVAVATDNPDLFAGGGIDLAGDGGDRELVFAPAAGVTGSASITVTASDSAGQTSAVSFLLSVAPQQLAFGTVLRSAFEADENDVPITLNDKELNQDDASYDDLLRN